MTENWLASNAILDEVEKRVTHLEQLISGGAFDLQYKVTILEQRVKEYEDALEWLASTSSFDSLHKNWKTKMYALCRLSDLGRDDGISTAMTTPLSAIQQAMSEEK